MATPKIIKGVIGGNVNPISDTTISKSVMYHTPGAEPEGYTIDTPYHITSIIYKVLKSW